MRLALNIDAGLLVNLLTLATSRGEEGSQTWRLWNKKTY